MHNDMILAMYSGGLDSLGMVYVLLTDEKYKNYGIHVHHVSIHNVENRASAEKHAVANTLRWFKTHCRKFEYSESMIGFNAYNEKFLYDSDVTNFFGGYIASCSDTIKHVAWGVSADDLQDTSLASRNERSLKIFHSFTDAEKIRPLSEMTKLEIYDMLPEDLREMAWSCRHPKYFNKIPVRCGECKTCEALDKIIRPTG